MKNSSYCEKLSKALDLNKNKDKFLSTVTTSTCGPSTISKRKQTKSGK